MDRRRHARPLSISPAAGLGFLASFVGIGAGVGMLVFVGGVGPQRPTIWLGGHLLVFLSLGIFAASLLAVAVEAGLERALSLVIASASATIAVAISLLGVVLAYADVLAFELEEYELIYGHVYVFLGTGFIVATALLVGVAVGGIGWYLERDALPRPWVATAGLGIGAATAVVAAVTLVSAGAEDSILFAATGAGLLVSFIWVGVIGALGIREG